MDQGNTTFILIAAALVLLMTPGLAFFYGGLVKAKSVISMMMLSFGAIGLIGVLWVLYGYAITFANNVGIDGLIGIDTGAIGLTSLLEVPEGAAFPPLAFAAFQATFAIITVALISGAIADRAKFGAWMVFAGIWATVVYFFDGDWWGGILLGLVAVVAATMGDLCESVIKRDLGVKDMSQIIPGHGGLMDRLDSLLATAAPTYLLLHYLVF